LLRDVSLCGFFFAFSWSHLSSQVFFFSPFQTFSLTSCTAFFGSRTHPSITGDIPYEDKEVLGEFRVSSLSLSFDELHSLATLH